MALILHLKDSAGTAGEAAGLSAALACCTQATSATATAGDSHTAAPGSRREPAARGAGRDGLRAWMSCRVRRLPTL